MSGPFSPVLRSRQTERQVQVVQQNQNADAGSRIKRLDIASNGFAITMVVSILAFGVLFDYMSRSLKGPLSSSSGLDQRIALGAPTLAAIGAVATTSFTAGALAATEVLKSLASLSSKIKVPESVDCAVITMVGLTALAFSLNDTIDYVNMINLAALGVTCLAEVASGSLPKLKILALLTFGVYTAHLSTRP